MTKWIYTIAPNDESLFRYSTCVYKKLKRAKEKIRSSYQFYSRYYRQWKTHHDFMSKLLDSERIITEDEFMKLLVKWELEK